MRPDASEARYRKAKELFLAVCDMAPPERAAVLDERCAGDAALRAEVESLLLHHDDRPPDAVVETIPDSRSHPMTSAADGSASHRVGPWRIIHELGRGGMGVVYLADREDESFRQRAAVKVLKRGTDTLEVLHRFEQERQLLALLNHPGIARLYDGGESDDGLPYFAMEYVEGLPLDEYSDEQRLSIEARLKLFQRVCESAHHAHQNLVVHRDLKPSNILVTKTGEPKLLDFGIAKIINPEFALVAGDPTAPELRVMTPEYASPEQVRGNPLTTASDVYTLGVILYELVTGRRPYLLKTRMRDEIERVVCEQDPALPSTAVTHRDHVDRDDGTQTVDALSRARHSAPSKLRRRLAGDLDNIILKAMRKEPQRRYQSAEALAEDIGRHLRGLPVTARPDTFGYRAGKFIRRHRAGVSAAALVGILLGGGVVGTSSGWHQANQERGEAVQARDEADDARRAEADQRRRAEVERDRADRRFRQVRALARTFMYDFHDAIQQLDGSIPARELLVETALEYLEGLEGEAGDDPELTAELAHAYVRVGDIRGGIRNPSRGDLGEALDHYEKSRELRAALVARDDAQPQWRRDLSKSHIRIGDVRRARKDLAGALSSYEAAQDIAEAQLDAAPDGVTERWDLSIVLVTIGDVKLSQGERAEAEQRYDEALELRRSVVAETPDEPNRLRGLALVHARLGGCRRAIGDHGAALGAYASSIEIREGLVEANPASGRYRRDLAVTQYAAALSLIALGRHDEALAYVQQYLAVPRRRVEADPQNARAKRDLALALELMSKIHVERGDGEAALEHAEAMRDVAQRSAAASPEGILEQQLHASSLLAVAAALRELGDDAQFIGLGEQALAVLGAAERHAPEARQVQLDLARAAWQLGTWLREVDRPLDAAAQLLAARDRYQALLAGAPDDAAAMRGLQGVFGGLAAVSIELGRAGDAVAYAESGLEIERTAELLTLLAEAHDAAGDPEAARAAAREGLERLGDDEPGAAELRRRLEAIE